MAANGNSNSAALAGLEIETDPQIVALKAQLAAAEKANAELRSAKQPAGDTTSANSSRASSKERFAIMIDEAREANEVDPVPVSVNGRLYQLQRGVIVEVPREVVGVLSTAVEDRSIPKKDSAGNPAGFDVRKARRFPFQNFGMAVNAEGKRTNVQVPTLNAVA